MTGAGFENAQVYQNITVEFMGIGNIHTQRENLKKLVQTCKVKEEETRRESREGKKGREAWQRREARKRSEEKRKERERERKQRERKPYALAHSTFPLFFLDLSQRRGDRLWRLAAKYLCDSLWRCANLKRTCRRNSGGRSLQVMNDAIHHDDGIMMTNIAVVMVGIELRSWFLLHN